ncbi:MAG TPA: cytochrome P450 [Polyangia bacterium]|nr:cytochrome P450 [Polyangia bacterium]
MSAGAGLPPGRTGLPFLGEVTEFLKDGFAFVESRTQRLGPVFKTKILGRPTAVIVGPDAAGRFIDESQIQREGGMLPHIQALFGGRALPVLDGDEHRERKAFVMAAFTREALAGYLPGMQRQVAAALESWAGAGELRWLDGFRRLALEVICTTILGLPPGPTLEAIARDYEIVGGGFSALPIGLPGTAYTRAKQALDRILAVFQKNVEDHRANPGTDGVDRILGARSARDGRTITVDEAKVELHHIVVAGLIVWAWFVDAVVELDRHPEVRERLRAEVAALPAGPLTPDAFRAAPYLTQVSNEIRRLSPVVHVFFGKARTTFEFAGHTIPEGWMVLWGIRSSHLRPEIYPEPDKFEPERFGPARREQDRAPHAFVPNGAGDAHQGHKCAGYEFAPLLLQVFLIELLRGGYRWSFAPGQDLSRDMSKIPPPPRDGLRATISR